MSMFKLTCEAVEAGNLDELRRLLKSGTPEWWHKDICASAARCGQLECLKYLHENGCPWNENTCAVAACGGHLECLKYLHENGCPWDRFTPRYAAKGGKLECLKYARENGCPWNEDTCEAAVDMGRLDCLKYLHENGCPWDEKTCKAAAKRGRLDCLKYLHENGCPWDENTCAAAADGGCLDCLKYAHENGCPWDEYTCECAARHGHHDCLTYADENGCPLDEKICIKTAVDYGNHECVRYLQLSFLDRLNQQVRIAIDNLKEAREAIPQEAYDAVWRHLEEFNVYTSPGREECYRDFQLEPWLNHVRDLTQSVMSALDEVKESIPTGAYLTLTNSLQEMYEFGIDYSHDEEWFHEEIF